jgi:hypothetical protein
MSRPRRRASRRSCRPRGRGRRGLPTTPSRSSAGAAGSLSRAGAASASARPCSAPSGCRGVRRSPSVTDTATGGRLPFRPCMPLRRPNAAAACTHPPRSRRRLGSSKVAAPCARRSAPSSAKSLSGEASSSASAAGAASVPTRRGSTSRLASTVACPSSSGAPRMPSGWRSRSARIASRSRSSPVHPCGSSPACSSASVGKQREHPAAACVGGVRRGARSLRESSPRTRKQTSCAVSSNVSSARRRLPWPSESSSPPSTCSSASGGCRRHVSRSGARGASTTSSA